MKWNIPSVGDMSAHSSSRDYFVLSPKFELALIIFALKWDVEIKSIGYLCDFFVCFVQFMRSLNLIYT
jgi:hypothetical protein